MKKVKKISILSVAKLQGLLGIFIGLSCGILYSVGGLIIDIMVSLNLISSSETPGLSIGTLLAFGALIAMPIIFGVSGYILGLIEGGLFNLISPLIGGVNIDLDSSQE